MRGQPVRRVVQASEHLPLLLLGVVPGAVVWREQATGVVRRAFVRVVAGQPVEHRLDRVGVVSEDVAELEEVQGGGVVRRSAAERAAPDDPAVTVARHLRVQGVEALVAGTCAGEAPP
eukprot:COSAG06_NODE_4231_length_4446_cov_10519.227743_1_plen_118_part_00